MANGISLYPGLDNKPLENLKLLEDAAHAGLTRIFTSLQIPESNTHVLKAELGTLLRAAREHRMEVISDVSPKTRNLLGIRDFSLSAFRMLGITTLRLDYGFSIDEIVRYSRNRQGIRIALNASTLTSDTLSQLVAKKANFQNIEAIHNFYPRRGTGISGASLVGQNIMLRRRGIETGAFVPSRDGRRRSPLRDGLPTLEAHRDADTAFAARQLLAMNCDFVLIGDALPTREELRRVGSLPSGEVVLSAKWLTGDPVSRQLLAHTFTSRIDAARDATRAQESRRLLASIGSIAPEHTVDRPFGAITLDNEGYGRYMGELQIIQRAQDADPRTNVVGQIDADDLSLIPYITPGRKFSFRFHD